MAGKIFKRLACFLPTLCAVVIMSVPVFAADIAADRLAPVGHTVGIRLDVDGVVVAALHEVDGVCPAREAGISEGDIIKSVNGTSVADCRQFMELVSACGEDELTLGLSRAGSDFELTLSPYASQEGAALGLWVRDSIAGIGTLTFYDAETGIFGALGHGVNDSETGELLPLRSGAVMYSVVTDVTKGVSGTPGQLHGNFSFDEELGTVSENTDGGVFGVIMDGALTDGLTELETVSNDEIRTGDAVILANIDGDEVEEFAINIVRVYPNAQDSLRSMVIEITDGRLLDESGGIVQGMSGSPIIQDGKLIGAVTHVLVNDPTRGYGISIEDMLDAAGFDSAG